MAESSGKYEDAKTSAEMLRNTPSNIRRLADEIQQFEGRQKYLAQTRSPSDGGDVRWYYSKVPMAENELAAAVPHTEVVGKGDYFRFGMRDSLAIEASFLQQEEELLTNWWREYGECSEGPKGVLSSIPESDPHDVPSTQSSKMFADEEERVGVPVKGGLYEVDLLRRHSFPVYWNGDNRRVLRGHWFARKGSLDWLPLREDVAEQLEFAYRGRVWHRRTFQPSGLFAARVDMPGSSPGLHALFTGEDDTWEAWLYIGLSGFGSIVSFGVTGLQLRRGYARSQSPKPTQDELRQKKEEEMDDYCSQVPVRHLVFMVHGIGQRLQKANLVDDVGTFRQVTESLADLHLTNYQRESQRVLFIPCQWRKELKLSGESAVDRCTLPGVRGLRVTLSATVHDVLYYMSPIYCQDIIDSVSNQLNRLYLKFLKRNPGYDGKVSLYGHSLGSVLSYDILCHQETLSSPFPMEWMYKDHNNHEIFPEGNTSLTCGDKGLTTNEEGITSAHTEAMYKDHNTHEISPEGNTSLTSGDKNLTTNGITSAHTEAMYKDHNTHEISPEGNTSLTSEDKVLTTNEEGITSAHTEAMYKDHNTHEISPEGNMSLTSGDKGLTTNGITSAHIEAMYKDHNTHEISPEGNTSLTSGDKGLTANEEGITSPHTEAILPETHAQESGSPPTLPSISDGNLSVAEDFKNLGSPELDEFGVKFGDNSFKMQSEKNDDLDECSVTDSEVITSTLNQIDDEINKHDEDVVIRSLKEEIDILNARIKELESHRAEENKQEASITTNESFSENSKNDTLTNYTPYIKYTKLLFKVDTFFAVGSPLGVFLALRNVRIGIGKGKDYWEDVTINEEMPSCRQMFNIFHPYDPVAYRVEPLVCKEHMDRDPVIIPYHRGGKRLHVGYQEFVEHVASRRQVIVDNLSLVKVKVLTLCQSRDSDGQEETTEEPEETGRPYGSVMMERLTGSEDGRIDHVLQNKTFEHQYISAVGAHTKYWRDPDTALFILKHLYHNIPNDPQTPSKNTNNTTNQESDGNWEELLNDEQLPLTFANEKFLKQLSDKAKKLAN